VGKCGGRQGEWQVVRELVEPKDDDQTSEKMGRKRVVTKKGGQWRVRQFAKNIRFVKRKRRGGGTNLEGVSGGKKVISEWGGENQWHKITTKGKGKKIRKYWGKQNLI